MNLETLPVRYPDSAIFERSEFIYPLAENDRSAFKLTKGKGEPS